jgi:hypothetical protein
MLHDNLQTQHEEGQHIRTVAIFPLGTLVYLTLQALLDLIKKVRHDLPNAFSQDRCLEIANLTVPHRCQTSHPQTV